MTNFISSNIKYKVYTYMKLTVSFRQNTAHIHIHRSRSKSKLKTVANHSKSTHKTHFHTHSTQYQTDSLVQNILPFMKESRPPHKQSCEHKKKMQIEESGDYEYSKMIHRSREQLQRQNEKLRKENKVLNEYCTYFDKKLSKQLKKPSQRVFSFRKQDCEGARLLFGEISKQTAATCSKSNSIMHRYYQ